MAVTRTNEGRRVVRQVYVPAPVALAVGWPGHSGLANRQGADRNRVLAELLARGLQVAREWAA